MPIDLSGTVLSFASSYTITRATPSTYVEGVVVPGTSSTLEIQALVCPLSGADLAALPEGQFTREDLQVFAVVALRVEAQDVEPDRISVHGQLWKVIKLERWTPQGNFYRAIVRKDE